MSKAYKIKINLNQIQRNSGLISSNEISTEYLGEHIATSDKWNVNAQILIEKELLTIKDIKKNDLKDKSIYRFPKLKLPRNKVDLLKEELNMTVTRSRDSADYLVTSLSFIESFIKTSWDYCIPVTVFKEAMNNSIDFKKHFTDKAIALINHWVSTLNDEDVILFNGYYNRNHKDPFDYIKKAGRQYCWYITKEHYSDYNVLTSAYNIILDSQVVDFCNESLHVLTEEEFNTIEKILEPSLNGSTEDQAMALEMMANCNLTKCYDKVAYLYYFNYDVLRYCKNWNHVNVKAFKKTVPEPQNNVHSAYFYSNLVKFIIKKNCLTQFIVDKILEKVVSLGIGAFGFNKTMFQLDPSSIKISDEFQSKVIKPVSGEEIIKEITLDPIDDLPF